MQRGGCVCRPVAALLRNHHAPSWTIYAKAGHFIFIKHTVYSSVCVTHSSHSRTWAETWCWSQRTQNPADSAWRHQRTVGKKKALVSPASPAGSALQTSVVLTRASLLACRQAKFQSLPGLVKKRMLLNAHWHTCVCVYTHTHSDQLRGSERPIRIQQSGSTSVRWTATRKSTKTRLSCVLRRHAAVSSAPSSLKCSTGKLCSGNVWVSKWKREWWGWTLSRE